MLDEKTFLEILERNDAEIIGEPGTYIGGEKKSLEELYAYITMPLTDALSIEYINTRTLNGTANYKYVGLKDDNITITRTTKEQNDSMVYAC